MLDRRRGEGHLYGKRLSATAGRRAGVTIPNIITLFRLLLAPAVVYTLLEGATGWALAGFLVAGISDGVDGFIARRWPSQRSELGAWLDPLADKLLLVSVFAVLGIAHELPLWLVFAVVSRDVIIMGAVLLADLMGRPMAMRPLFVSKANTALQILLVAVVLTELAFATGFWILRDALVVVVALLTAASAAAYLTGWLRHMGEHGKSDNPRG
jgi:cardiolipin synthase